jgi:hypothetical protein
VEIYSTLLLSTVSLLWITSTRAKHGVSCLSIIPAIRDMAINRILVWGQPKQKVSENSSQFWR